MFSVKDSRHFFFIISINILLLELVVLLQIMDSSTFDNQFLRAETLVSLFTFIPLVPDIVSWCPKICHSGEDYLTKGKSRNS